VSARLSQSHVIAFLQPKAVPHEGGCHALLLHPLGTVLLGEVMGFLGSSPVGTWGRGE